MAIKKTASIDRFCFHETETNLGFIFQKCLEFLNEGLDHDSIFV